MPSTRSWLMSRYTHDFEIENMEDNFDPTAKHPADNFNPDQKLSLMTLPPEIRDHIFSFVAEPKFWKDELRATRIDADTKTLRQLPIEIRSTVIDAYYRRRYLLIDLPNFEPRPLGHHVHNGIKQYKWPSEIHFHDQWEDLSFRTVPAFLSKHDPKATPLRCVPHEDIRSLPLHLFKEIVIKIPSNQSGDIAQFIMNWNRLRFLGNLLMEAIDIDQKGGDFEGITYDSKGLPPVKIVFVEDEQSGATWFDKSNRLKTSLPLPAELLLGEEREHSSDLLLLLRALAPVRGSSKFSVEPTLPDSFQNLDFSLAWMSRNSTQIQRFGEYMDMQWNDLLSFHWLTRFEFYLQRLLHYLDTPIAPFLRLEQMATASHTRHIRIDLYTERNRLSSEICEHASDVIGAIGRCAFAFAPEHGRSLCSCAWSSGAQTSANGCVFEGCALSFPDYNQWVCPWLGHEDHFNTAYQSWQEEFKAVRRKLLLANGHTLTDEGRISTTNFQPLHPPITLGQAHRYGFERYIESRPTKARKFNDFHDLCECFTPTTLPEEEEQKSRSERRADPEAWIKAWPCGIVHSEQLVRSYRAVHHCRNIAQYPNMTRQYLCLDISRRDKDGICDGGGQNTSAPFLAQFAHLTMKAIG